MIVLAWCVLIVAAVFGVSMVGMLVIEAPEFFAPLLVGGGIVGIFWAVAWAIDVVMG